MVIETMSSFTKEIAPRYTELFPSNEDENISVNTNSNHWIYLSVMTVQFSALKVKIIKFLFWNVDHK